MRTFIFIFLSLVFSNYSLSQEKTNAKRKFKSVIEISIDSTSRKINPLIEKSNIAFKEGKSNEELVRMYDESKLSFKIYKEIVGKLSEVDTDINLKAQTLIYLNNCDKLLDNLILPIIKHLNNSEEINIEEFKQAFVQLQETINQASSLSDSMEKFCDKYKLPIRLEDFDKEDYRKSIEEIKTKIGN